MKTELEKKYEEMIVYLKALTISHSPDEEYENRLLSEIAVLKEQQEVTVSTEKVRDKLEILIDNAINFELETYDRDVLDFICELFNAHQGSKMSDEMIEKYAKEYLIKQYLNPKP